MLGEAEGGCDSSDTTASAPWSAMEAWSVMERARPSVEAVIVARCICFFNC